ncbi:DUF4240 domain-containing protein [Chondromyces apiculatus]|uniref:DUF4240 domain-containing protein n=1 Tax=Chondromyces apiculatus DSM 436 TaxID=1192034 RepID=A0A017T8R6_9BACT|nr:DUF4240 domain-containing protein [Chondromyces apiculatus]EYF05643.1 Hypothetical protein CAP_2933 [Chondromyces apiculatus DSM 436]
MEDEQPFRPTDISEWFWTLIRKAGKNRETLRALLSTLSRDEIHRFHREFEDASVELQTDPFLQHIDEDESEDGVEDIANWVVSQGFEVYQDVWDHPSHIPPHVDVGNREDLYGIAGEVYAARFSQSIGEHEEEDDEENDDDDD